jgi:predicted protein tyrosine phosphatase
MTVNVFDPRQGTAKRVLCVCYGNQLRSPTMAWVLSNPPYDLNTRSCGVDPGSAVCLINETMMNWADEVVCAEDAHVYEVLRRFPVVRRFNGLEEKPRIWSLKIPDNYCYRDPVLAQLIGERYCARTARY